MSIAIASNSNHVMTEETSPFNFNHTSTVAKGVPRAIFIAVMAEGIATEDVVSASFGGVSVPSHVYFKNASTSLQYIRLFAFYDGAVPDPGVNAVSIGFTGLDANGANGLVSVIEVQDSGNRILTDDTFDSDGVASYSLTTTSRSEGSISIAIYSGGSDCGTITYNNGQTVLYGAYTGTVSAIVSHLTSSGLSSITQSCSFSLAPNRGLGYAFTIAPYRSRLQVCGGP